VPSQTDTEQFVVPKSIPIQTPPDDDAGAATGAATGADVVEVVMEMESINVFNQRIQSTYSINVFNQRIQSTYSINLCFGVVCDIRLQYLYIYSQHSAR
jgi:hypothetical protein